MKLLLTFICILFYVCSTEAVESRSKRNLSPDAQQKLVDLINLKRRKVGKKIGRKMGMITYNTTLEKVLDGIKDCGDDLPKESKIFTSPIIPLDYDYKHYMATRKKTDQSMAIAFFNTDSYSVACSSTYQCAKFEWKTLQSNVRGACVTNSLMNDPPEVTEEIIGTILPWPFLFTTIVGVKPYINITSENEKIMYGLIPDPRDAEYMEEEKKDGDAAVADGDTAKTSGLSGRIFIVALIFATVFYI